MEEKSEKSMEEEQILRDNREFFKFEKPKDKNGESLSIGDRCRWRWVEGTIDKFMISNKKLLVNFLYETNENKIESVYTDPGILEKIESDTWERIISDARLGAWDYFGKYPEAKEIPPTTDSLTKIDIHLLERCKKLAGMEE